MSFNPDSLPEKIKKQRGLSRYQKGFLNRKKMTQEFADHLIAIGERVTIDKVRELLVWVDRDYSLNADQIRFALKARYRDGRVDRFTNGHQVRIGKKLFATKRNASREHGVWPQTVENRIKSADPKWKDWTRA